MKTETVIAANRFGLGAKPGELATIASDPRGWLADQLANPPGSPAEVAALPGSAEVLVEVQEARAMRREARERAADDEGATDIVRRYGAVVRRHYLQQAHARIRVAAGSNAPFHERLVHFWSNHFAVSADKQPLPAVAGLYENEAIRPNLHGSFADLLLAAESHPAMILYLDNQRSVGPNSAAARRVRRRRNNDVGLNENLAREILELHTLGVDGGYSQADVTAFARVLTGWSIGGGDRPQIREGEPGTFRFRDSIHEPGAETILGRRYGEGGMHQGLAVLRDLAVHPSTARHLATQLARHFVADEPPAAVVDDLARTFLETDGDLPSLHAALVTGDAAWKPELAKYKSPEDFAVSALRAFGRVPDDARRAVGSLELMGQPIYRPGSPAGWPDTAAAWGGADALYKRIEWADAVGRLAGDLRVNPVQVAESALGPALGARTRSAVAGAESVRQGLTLFLVSPEFQRR